MFSAFRLFRLPFVNKKYIKLLIPMTFFLYEVIVALVLNWQLFGEKYEFSDRNGKSGISVHNPLIVIRSVHSDRLTHPYGSLTPETPLIHFYNDKSMVKAICFLASLVFAYIGIFISLLWVNRTFRENLVNIRWWLWPVACLGAHTILFFIANNVQISNIFPKQF